MPDDRLPIELRQDPAASEGDLVGALAGLVIERARKVLAHSCGHGERAGDDRRPGRQAEEVRA